MVAVGDGKVHFGTRLAVHPEVVQWVQGYLTALSFAEAANGPSNGIVFARRLRETEKLEIADAIKAGCSQQPLTKLGDIAFSIYKQLDGREFYIKN